MITLSAVFAIAVKRSAQSQTHFLPMLPIALFNASRLLHSWFINSRTVGYSSLKTQPGQSPFRRKTGNNCRVIGELCTCDADGWYRLAIFWTVRSECQVVTTFVPAQASSCCSFNTRVDGIIYRSYPSQKKKNRELNICDPYINFTANKDVAYHLIMHMYKYSLKCQDTS